MPTNTSCHFCGIPLTEQNSNWREVTITNDETGDYAFVCNDCAEMRHCDMCDEITDHPLQSCPGVSIKRHRILLRHELNKSKRESELYNALLALYEETADYIRVNHLGDVHHNKTMRDARKALGLTPK